MAFESFLGVSKGNVLVQLFTVLGAFTKDVRREGGGGFEIVDMGGRGRGELRGWWTLCLLYVPYFRKYAFPMQILERELAGWGRLIRI